LAAAILGTKNPSCVNVAPAMGYPLFISYENHHSNNHQTLYKHTHTQFNNVSVRFCLL
jgi:hypothetical protein